jgi:hypothetical protein
VNIEVRSGVQALNLQLGVAATSQQISVQESGGASLTTDPSANANAIVLRGDDLQALADDPEDLAADSPGAGGAIRWSRRR